MKCKYLKLNSAGWQEVEFYVLLEIKHVVYKILHMYPPIEISEITNVHSLYLTRHASLYKLLISGLYQQKYCFDLQNVYSQSKGSY